uniref:ATP-binding protein n=1 Tax=Agathobacter sp. TaxID=2021311 RepID=UPI0040578150
MQSIKTIVYSIIYKMEKVLELQGDALLKGTELEYLLEAALKYGQNKLNTESDVVGQRYRTIQKILEDNAFAKNVFDLTLAGYMCPAFQEELKKKTTFGSCVIQGCNAEGKFAPSYQDFHETWELANRLLFLEKSEVPFYMRSYYMDDRLFDYLNGNDMLPRHLRGFISCITPKQEEKPIYGMEELAAQAEMQIAQGNLFCIEGRCGSGRRSIVCQAAKNQNRSLLILDLTNVSMEDLQRYLFEIHRELYLNMAFLCIHGLSGEWLKKQERTKEEFLHFCKVAFTDYGFFICFCTEPGLLLVQASKQLMVEIAMPELGRKERIRLWQLFAEENGLSLPTEQLGIKYRLLPGEIKKACELLKLIHGNAHPISEQQVGKICQKVLPAVAVRGRIVYADEKMTLADLKLPKQEKQQLLDICNHVRFSHTVLDKWNMESRFSYGKAVSALFCGASGTGKTMAANILGSELGYPLYHVDLSRMIDKYIGETEKHLQQVFEQAQKSNTILFFDEADSLFGKRSEVKDSKDRHANTQVSFILQRIEEYDGMVILATNLKENIDPAFMRRIKYLVHFPKPTEEVRREIWESCFAEEVPTEYIDFAYLSSNFELSGGNIKNIVLMAAFYAAAEQSAVGMAHVIRAIKNEYQKIGRLLMREELGKYALYLDM